MFPLLAIEYHSSRLPLSLYKATLELMITCDPVIHYKVNELIVEYEQCSVYKEITRFTSGMNNFRLV